MTPRLAIALQVWSGDVFAGKRLVELICKIEPAIRSDVEFILSARRDTNPEAINDILKLAQTKFVNVQVIKCKRFGVGWPNSCNDQWAETMMRVSQMKGDGRIKSSGALTFEPDCLPLRPDWLDILIDTWETAQVAGLECVGHQHGQPSTHINGNAIFDCHITKKHPELNGSDSRTGWDVFHGQLLMKIGMDTPFIYQRYRIHQITKEELLAERKDGVIPALFHGIKDPKGIGFIHSMIEDGSFKQRMDGEPKKSTSFFNEDGKTLISVLCLNRLESTRECLTALLRNTTDEEFDVLVTDNASTDGTAEYLRDLALAHPNVKIVTNKENLGFIPPNNQAFEEAINGGYAYFVALNNDTLPPPGWLTKLKEPLLRNPKAALSGASGTCRSFGENFHGHPGGSLEYIEGSCLCVKISLVAPMKPLFSDSIVFAYGEDLDLSLRVREAGYTIHEGNFRIKHRRGETSKDPAVAKLCREAQAHNLKVLQKRWAEYLKTHSFAPKLDSGEMMRPIVIKRRGAIGDVLLTTPIIRAIKETLPLAQIHVETDVPQVLEGNPHTYAVKRKAFAAPEAIVIDLNMAYEDRKEIHYVRAYEEVARKSIPNLRPVKLRAELFIGDPKPEKYKLCVMHFEPTAWAGRNWPIDRAEQISEWLNKRGFSVIAVGNKPWSDEVSHTHTTMHELATLLRRASLFVGIDSFPMHAAQAVGCPTVGVFGMSRSEYVMTNGSPHVGVDADPSIPCAGIRHRDTGKTLIQCSPACIESVTVEQVKAAIESLL